MPDQFVTDNSIFMNSRLVATFSKNKLETIRVSVLKNNKIDIRAFFFFPNDPEPRPTRKGIWLSFKHIPPIRAAFAAYCADATKEFDLAFEQNEKEKIRVYVSEYKGSKIVHIRNFYLRNNEYCPGKGISFAVGIAPKMLEALKELDKFAPAV